MALVGIDDPLLGHPTPGKKSKVITKAVLGAATTIAVLVLVFYSQINASGGRWEGLLLKGRRGSEENKSRTGYVIEAEEGAVAAEDGRCSEIGVAALRAGGNAVDAAVATTLCLGVINPMSSGIGGGGFMVFRSAQTGRTQAYDFRETAPLASSQNMYDKNPKTKAEGPLAMGVPGEIAGLHAAWIEHGRLPWRSLFQPAIKLAREGFVIGACLGEYMMYSKDQIMADSGLQEVLAPNGNLLQKGDICYNPKLADTLELISEQGADVFYNGIIGEKLVRDVQATGGILTMEDLRQYRVEVKDAMTVNVMGYTILGMGPPSSGTAGLALILNILESYGDVDAAKGPLGLHRLLEAQKHMLAVRMNLGDPDFVNNTEYVSAMLSQSFAGQVQQMILDNTTFPASYYLAKWSQLLDRGTSHFNIIDADRNALSMTSTVNAHFGAGVRSPSTGIILNNEMDDFSMPTKGTADGLPPAPPNFIQPKKRPLSAMTPIIILKDNQLAGVLGGSGGLYIPPGVIQVFLNHFVYGMEPLAAVKHPRVYHKLIPNVAIYEKWIVYNGDEIELSEEAVQFLASRGHILSGLPRGSGCQLLVHDLHNPVKMKGDGRGGFRNGVFRGKLTAVSDPRKDGKPAGF
ncbi:glutathione hydrolase 3-like [Aristolochia californica]|uniref:glutathione hydrolase 3-like n=1 Tax=Aristolochia californica TaxID=171875 RepID=UPI0035D6E090